MPLFAVPIFVSTAAMLMIAIDRYMLIVYPFMKRMTNRTAIIIVALSIVFTICFAIPSILHIELHQVHIPEVNFHSSVCIENWPVSRQTQLLMYSVGIFSIQFAIPLIIVAILYFRIYLMFSNPFLKLSFSHP
jgi:TM2 domain-containing membrane protein YozV